VDDSAPSFLKTAIALHECEKVDLCTASGGGLYRRSQLRDHRVARVSGLQYPDVFLVRPSALMSSRFEQFGLDSLKDKAGRGRKPSTKKVERVITEVTRAPKSRRR
jgi:hypothetical protein